MSSESSLPPLESLLLPGESYTADELSMMAQLRDRVIQLLKGPPPKTNCPVSGCWRDVVFMPENLHTPEYSMFNQRPYPEYSAPCLNPSNWQPSMLVRFLRARKNDLSKSAEMLHIALTIWSNYRSEEMTALTPMPFEKEIRSIVPDSLHLTDRDGRVVYYQQTGRINVDRFVTKISNEKLFLTHMHFTEKVSSMLRENSIRLGKRVDQMILVMDLAGVSLLHRKTVKFFSITAFIDQHLNPERLYRMYFINSPSYFPVFWALCKPFLDPVTQAKIVVLGKNYKERLIADIGEDNLPAIYGGNCKCEPECVRSTTPWPYEEESGAAGWNGLGAHKAELEAQAEKIEWKEIQIGAGKEFAIQIDVKAEEFTKAEEEKKSSQGDQAGADSNTDALKSLSLSPADHGGSAVVELQGWWIFQVAAKDVLFSASYQPAPTEAEPKPAPIQAMPNTKCLANPSASSSSSSAASDACHRGYFTIPSGIAGSLKLIWDNKPSYFSGKTVKYKAGIRKIEHKL